MAGDRDDARKRQLDWQPVEVEPPPPVPTERHEVSPPPQP